MSSSVPLALVPLALAVVVGVVLLAYRQPRAGVTVWLVVICVVPVWFGISISYYFSPASLVGIPVAIALLARKLPPIGVVDLLAVFFFVACLAPVVLGGSTDSTVFTVLAEWLVAYVIGRFATAVAEPEWIYSVVAVLFTIVGLWAVIEYFLHWHPFVDLGPKNGLSETWAPIQGRGAQERSEGAFGHSIALGACLAMAMPLTLMSRFRPAVRLLMVVAMLAGTVFTLSRVSLGCAALGLLLTVAFVRSERIAQVRGWVLGILGAAAAAVVPMFLTVLADAGSEASDSGEYRGWILRLVPEIDLVGFSSVAYRTPSGVLRFGEFRSIDNALLLIGLTYGAIAIVIGLVLLVIATLRVLVRRASAPVVAIVAQIPALVSVALITQYAMFFWFVAGLAVATSIGSGAASTSPGRGRDAPLQLTASTAVSNSPG